VGGEEVGGVLEGMLALPPGDEKVAHNADKEQAIDENVVLQLWGGIAKEKVNNVARDNGGDIALQGLVGADLGDDFGLPERLAGKVLDAVAASNGHAKIKGRGKTGEAKRDM